MTIRKAERKRTKLRMGIVAPSGAGKTYSALLLAFGLVGDDSDGKIGLIDTENGSGDVYADLGPYDIINIGAPFEVKKYTAAIKEFEASGYEVIIIDSLSHAWAGEGGLLDKQGKIADKGGNSYTAWRQVTPDHNALVEAMLQSKSHIIATMRAKTEYVQEKDEKSGRTVVRKIGLAPVQRDSLEYEFGLVFDISANHVASVSKDRTRVFDGRFFTVERKHGQELLTWLESGAAAAPAAQAPAQSANAEATVEGALDESAYEPHMAAQTAQTGSDYRASGYLLEVADKMNSVKHNTDEPLKALGVLQTIFGEGYRSGTLKDREWLQPIYNERKRKLIEDGLRAFTDPAALKIFKTEILLKTGNGDHGWILAEYEVCQDALRKIRAGATAVDMPETSQA